MKKVLAFILAASLVMSLVACDNKTPSGGDDSTTAPSSNAPAAKSTTAAPDFSKVEGSDFYAITKVLKGDTFTFEMKEFSLAMYRRGDDVYVNLMNSMLEYLVIDKKSYTLDDKLKKASYKKITDKELGDIMSTVNTLDRMIILDGAEVTGSGKAEFIHYGETYYEEITESGGEVKLAFFNEEGDLVGFRMNDTTGALADYEIIVSPNVPEGILEIPEDYEQVEVTN